MGKNRGNKLTYVQIGQLTNEKESGRETVDEQRGRKAEEGVVG